MQLAWCTDIHLDHASTEARQELVDQIKSTSTEYVLVGGDISSGAQIISDLKWLSEELKRKQICFVLGNHDYYGSSLNQVWDEVGGLVRERSNLVWLDRSPIIEVDSETALVGSGLWCDWRAGNYRSSSVWLNDYRLISELKANSFGPFGSRELLKDTLREVAERHLSVLRGQLEMVLGLGYSRILILTHVPPFWEGSFGPGGQVQNAEWAPHFVCAKAGEEIREMAKLHPGVEFRVLSGHTHFGGEVQISDNVRVVNGSAEYQYPVLQDVDWEGLWR